jgi:hypothetical protein
VDAPLIESFTRMFSGAPAATDAPSET